MKSKFDKENDILHISFSSEPIEESEQKCGIIIDYDNTGKIVSIEILNATQKISNPDKLDEIRF
jgi:uncharacterized protein YuzE